MYGTRFTTRPRTVFRDFGEDRIAEFTKGELQTMILAMLDRKARNNGVARWILGTLETAGRCHYQYPGRWNARGITCIKHGRNRYSVTIVDDAHHQLVGRLNDPDQQERALAYTSHRRQERRALRDAGLHVPTYKNRLRPIAGQSRAFKRHFKNNRITFDQAVLAIAHASRLTCADVRERLAESLRSSTVGIVKLSPSFTFRLDLAGSMHLSGEFVSLVSLSSTDDNGHGAYRRLRNKLKKLLKREPRIRRVYDRQCA